MTEDTNSNDGISGAARAKLQPSVATLLKQKVLSQGMPLLETAYVAARHLRVVNPELNAWLQRSSEQGQFGAILSLTIPAAVFRDGTFADVVHHEVQLSLQPSPVSPEHVEKVTVHPRQVRSLLYYFLSLPMRRLPAILGTRRRWTTLDTEKELERLRELLITKDNAWEAAFQFHASAAHRLPEVAWWPTFAETLPPSAMRLWMFVPRHVGDLGKILLDFSRLAAIRETELSIYRRWLADTMSVSAAEISQISAAVDNIMAAPAGPDPVAAPPPPPPPPEVDHVEMGWHTLLNAIHEEAQPPKIEELCRRVIDGDDVESFLEEEFQDEEEQAAARGWIVLAEKIVGQQRQRAPPPPPPPPPVLDEEEEQEEDAMDIDENPETEPTMATDVLQAVENTRARNVEAALMAITRNSRTPQLPSTAAAGAPAAPAAMEAREHAAAAAEAVVRRPAASASRRRAVGDTQPVELAERFWDNFLSLRTEHLASYRYHTVDCGDRTVNSWNPVRANHAAAAPAAAAADDSNSSSGPRLSLSSSCTITDFEQLHADSNHGFEYWNDSDSRLNQRQRRQLHYQWVPQAGYVLYADTDITGALNVPTRWLGKEEAVTEGPGASIYHPANLFPTSAAFNSWMSCEIDKRQRDYRYYFSTCGESPAHQNNAEDPWMWLKREVSQIEFGHQRIGLKQIPAGAAALGLVIRENLGCRGDSAAAIRLESEKFRGFPMPENVFLISPAMQLPWMLPLLPRPDFVRQFPGFLPVMYAFKDIKRLTSGSKLISLRQQLVAQPRQVLEITRIAFQIYAAVSSEMLAAILPIADPNKTQAATNLKFRANNSSFCNDVLVNGYCDGIDVDQLQGYYKGAQAIARFRFAWLRDMPTAPAFGVNVANFVDFGLLPTPSDSTTMLPVNQTLEEYEKMHNIFVHLRLAMAKPLVTLQERMQIRDPVLRGEFQRIQWGVQSRSFLAAAVERIQDFPMSPYARAGLEWVHEINIRDILDAPMFKCNRFRNLSFFGEHRAFWGLIATEILEIHSNMVLATLLRTALLGCGRWSNSGTVQQPTILLSGLGAAGKSVLMKMVALCSIPRMIHIITDQTARADAIAGNDDDGIHLQEEVNREFFGYKGEPTAATKHMLESGHHSTRAFDSRDKLKNEGPQARTAVTIHHTLRGARIYAYNFGLDGADAALLSRFLILYVGTLNEERETPGYRLIDRVLGARSISDLEARREPYLRLLRFIAYMVQFVEKAIQSMILPDVSVEGSSAILVYLMSFLIPLLGSSGMVVRLVGHIWRSIRTEVLNNAMWAILSGHSALYYRRAFMTTAEFPHELLLQDVRKYMFASKEIIINVLTNLHTLLDLPRQQEILRILAHMAYPMGKFSEARFCRRPGDPSAQPQRAMGYNSGPDYVIDCNRVVIRLDAGSFNDCLKVIGDRMQPRQGPEQLRSEFRALQEKRRTITPENDQNDLQWSPRDELNNDNHHAAEVDRQRTAIGRQLQTEAGEPMLQFREASEQQQQQQQQEEDIAFDALDIMADQTLDATDPVNVIGMAARAAAAAAVAVPASLPERMGTGSGRGGGGGGGGHKRAAELSLDMAFDPRIPRFPVVRMPTEIPLLQIQRDQGGYVIVVHEPTLREYHNAEQVSPLMHAIKEVFSTAQLEVYPEPVMALVNNLCHSKSPVVGRTTQTWLEKGCALDFATHGVQFDYIVSDDDTTRLTQQLKKELGLQDTLKDVTRLRRYFHTIRLHRRPGVSTQLHDYMRITEAKAKALELGVSSNVLQEESKRPEVRQMTYDMDWEAYVSNCQRHHLDPMDIDNLVAVPSLTKWISMARTDDNCGRPNYPMGFIIEELKMRAARVQQQQENGRGGQGAVAAAVDFLAGRGPATSSSRGNTAKRKR